MGTKFAEPLRDLAAQAYELSSHLCGTCRDLHALWPYIRLSRASTGVETHGSRLQAELCALFDRGLNRVLIAGSQDAGLLALVASSRAGADVQIAVLDICETPLELCRRLAREWSLSIETIRQDLCDLTWERRFDFVLVHGTLNFIAPDRRLAALTRIQRAIRPGGRLILLFNTSQRGAAEKQTGTGYGSLVLAELKRLNIPLPDKESVMLDRLDAHQRRRELREGAFGEPQEIETLLDAAGFSVIDCARLDVNAATLMDDYITKTSKRRFMALAEPKIAG